MSLIPDIKLPKFLAKDQVSLVKRISLYCRLDVGNQRKEVDYHPDKTPRSDSSPEPRWW